MMVSWRAAPIVLALVGAADVLLELGPTTLAAAQQATTVDALVAAGAELVGLAIVGWLIAVAAISLVAALPGWLGRGADTIVCRVAPAVVRSAVRASLGLGTSVLVGTSSALTLATLAPIPAIAATAPQPAHAWPSLDRGPVTAPAPRPLPMHVAYVVRPGDTLWAIAARHLGGRPGAAQIAAAWPAWWAANLGVIGDDPDRIKPGQRLTMPEGSVSDPADQSR